MIIFAIAGLIIFISLISSSSNTGTNNQEFYTEQSDLNPSTGLEMMGVTDIAGNSFGGDDSSGNW